jgi:hypothetical protein
LLGKKKMKVENERTGKGEKKMERTAENRMGRDSYKIRLAFQGVSVCSSSVTSDCGRPSRASGSSRPASWSRGRSRSPAGAVPLYRLVCVNVIRDWPCSRRSSGRPSPAGRAAPGRSDSSERGPFGVVGVSREPSPFGVNIGRIDVFRDWLLKSVVSGRSGCSMSIGFVIGVVGLVIVGQGVVQGASHRCT